MKTDLEVELSAWMVHALAGADLFPPAEKPARARRKPAKAEDIGISRARPVERELEQPEENARMQARVKKALEGNPAARVAWDAGFFNGPTQEYPKEKREKSLLHGEGLPDSAEKPYAKFANDDEEFLAHGKTWRMRARDDVWAHMKMEFDPEESIDDVPESPMGEIHVVGLTGRTFREKDDAPTNGNPYSAEVRQLREERMAKARARTMAQKWAKIKPVMRRIRMPEYLPDDPAIRLDYAKALVSRQ